MVKHNLIIRAIMIVSALFVLLDVYSQKSNSKKKATPEKAITLIQSDFGNSYMSHFQFGRTDLQIYSICQDNVGEMILAHKQGVIIFNGRDWTQVKLPSIPIVLKYLKDQNLILLGCENQYGYLQRNRLGVYEYYVLSDKTGVKGDFTDIKITNDFIFFYGDEILISHKRDNLKFDKSWPAAAGEIQHGIIQLENDIYLNIQNKGLYKIEAEGEKTLVPKSSLISQKQIAFSIPVSKNKIIVGALGNNIFTFDGYSINTFSTPSQKYLTESNLSGGIDLTDSTFAVSTISGGCIILNKKSGSVFKIVDIKSGLPDNEIYSIGKDVNNGLWLSHGFGVSMVNYNLPIKDFKNYQGIEGNILDVIVLNNKTYIATNQGVFYEDSIIKLKEIEKIKVTGKIKETEKVQDKKNVFRRWKDKITGTDKTLKKEDSERDNKKDKNEVKAKVYSVDYIFKKIKNIDGKCKQLLKYNDVLLVASNKGLYEIKGKESKQILKKEYVNCIQPSSFGGVFYIGTDKGITAIKRQNNKWVEFPKIQPKGFKEPVYSIAEDQNNNLWIGSDNKVFTFAIDKNLVAFSTTAYDFGTDFSDKFLIQQIDTSIFFFSTSQIYKFNPLGKKIEANNQFGNNSGAELNYITSQQNILWLKNENGWVCISNKFKPNLIQISLLNLLENIQNIHVDENNSLWVVDVEKGLYKIPADDKLSKFNENFKVFIQKIKDNKGNLVPLDQLEIASVINSLTFTMNAPYYLKGSGNTYQYIIRGMMYDWSEWNSNQDFVFYVQPGKYTIQVRAKNVLGEISTSEEYELFIDSPVWMKSWFIVLSIAFSFLILILIFVLIQKKREHKLQKDNKILEEKVEERTVEVVKQKEQIERKNRDITRSLKYARQIQTAVVPSVEILKQTVDDFFVFNRPKDIVSGDFYWTNKIDGKLLITAADCTGHGVPGAFLSLLGVTFLNEITSKIETLTASLILEKLRERVIKSLNQDNENSERFDGMDLTMVILDYEKMKMQFAGAYNSMYLIRSGELFEYKGDKMPVGMHAFRNKPFTNHDIEIIKGDVIYLFSDGFMDQFGGESGKKFFGKNFRALLTEIYQHPMQEQRELLDEIIDAWRGVYLQVDDILVIGLKI